MSFMTKIQNFRADRKVSQETTNAAQTVQTRTRSTGLPVFAVPFALAFVFMLMALVAPVSAEINLSVITETINAFIGLIDPITDLVVAVVPLWFVIMILGFIMGLLGAILALIKNGMKF